MMANAAKAINTVKPAIGVVCLARTTFDYEAAKVEYERIKKELQKEQEKIEFHFIKELVFEVDEIKKAAAELSREGVDALICISGTFHLGHLVLELTHRIPVPVLLWAPQEPPSDGGKIRFNSLCGVNLNASNLYKAGVRNYTPCFGNEVDHNWLAAIIALKALSEAKLGLAGSRAHGFFNLAFDELNNWNHTGILIDYYQLAEVFDYSPGKEETVHYVEKIENIFSCSDISTEQKQKTAALAARIGSFMEARGLDGLALRCWPEFAASYGIAPCAAMSLLQSEGKLLACEGDVEGLISMLIHRALGAETPFLADLSQVDFADDAFLLWHCGVAPCNLRDGRSKATLDTYFAGGRGVTAGFVLKEGPVSLLRFDSVGRDIRLFTKKGEAVPAEKTLKGTYARVKFGETARSVLEQVIYNGVAHHISVVYGEYLIPLEIMARIKGWKLIP